jgi:hypothetical protein
VANGCGSRNREALTQISKRDRALDVVLPRFGGHAATSIKQFKAKELETSAMHGPCHRGAQQASYFCNTTKPNRQETTRFPRKHSEFSIRPTPRNHRTVPFNPQALGSRPRRSTSSR